MKSMTQTKFRSAIKKTTQNYGAKNVRIFGSYARNEQTKTSDVDILLDMPKKSSLLDLIALKYDLESKLDIHVDVVTYKSIKPTLKARILQEAISL